MKYLTIITAFLAINSAMAQEAPSLKIAGPQLADYLAASADSVAAIIVKEVLSGKVQAYHDEGGNTLVPAKEIIKWKLNIIRDEVQIPDHHDPNNLKDTVIEEESYIPQYRYIMIEKEHYRFFLNEQKQFYVKKELFENTLNTKFLMAHSKVFGDTLMKMYDDQDASDISKKFAEAIHEQVLKGKIKAYRDNTLRSMIPVAELQNMPAATYSNDSAGYFQAYFKEETIGRQSRFRCHSLAQCSKSGAKTNPVYFVSRFEIESALAPEYVQLLMGAVNFTADNAGKK